jgi:hypothetical protein
MSKRADRRRSEFDQLLNAKMRRTVGMLWPGLPPVRIFYDEDSCTASVVFRGEVVVRAEGSSRRYADRHLARLLARFIADKARQMDRLADELTCLSASDRSAAGPVMKASIRERLSATMKGGSANRGDAAEGEKPNDVHACAATARGANPPNEAEVERLRAAIEGAPHWPECLLSGIAYSAQSKGCTCWKSAALSKGTAP